jgi:hypothetical protein
MKYSYNKIESVWTNSNYAVGIKQARELRAGGQNRDLYKAKIYRELTRDVDTGEQFAYKCWDLIEYGKPEKVIDWERAVTDLFDTEAQGLEQGIEASDIYNCKLEMFGHKWGNDSFSKATHGVHTAWLDLATFYKLDLQELKSQRLNQFFTIGD